MDRGTPQRKSERVTLTIKVDRNKFAPEFKNEPYMVYISQTDRSGKEIARVQATDKDSKVIFYSEFISVLKFVISHEYNHTNHLYLFK